MPWYQKEFHRLPREEMQSNRTTTIVSRDNTKRLSFSPLKYKVSRHTTLLSDRQSGITRTNGGASSIWQTRDNFYMDYQVKCDNLNLVNNWRIGARMLFSLHLQKFFTLPARRHLSSNVADRAQNRWFATPSNSLAPRATSMVSSCAVVR